MSDSTPVRTNRNGNVTDGASELARPGLGAGAFAVRVPAAAGLEVASATADVCDEPAVGSRRGFRGEAALFEVRVQVERLTIRACSEHCTRRQAGGGFQDADHRQRGFEAPGVHV